MADDKALLIVKAMATLKWSVGPKATFPSDRRNWPSAVHVLTGNMAARISCELSYTPYRAKNGPGKPLYVDVVQPSRTNDEHAKHGAWRWRRLTATADTLQEAKELAAMWYELNPSWRN